MLWVLGIGAIFALFSNTIWGSLRYRKTGKFASKLDPKRIRQYVSLHLIRTENYKNAKLFHTGFKSNEGA